MDQGRGARQLTRAAHAGLAALLVTAAAAAAAARSAHAHCAEPDVIRPLFRASAPDDIGLFMTFGNARSTDGGATWRLQCEEVYSPPGETIGPQNVHVTPGGTLVLGHYLGLITSEDGGCSYRFATGVPKDPVGHPEAVVDAAIDGSDPENRAWAVIADTLFRSTDRGASLTAARKFDGHVLLRILTSPTDTRALYVQSYISDAAGFRLYVHSTIDGTVWETNLWPFGADELVMARVCPDNPSRIYVVRGEADQRLYRSDDRGRTFTQLFAVATPGLRDFDKRLRVALGPAPDELWVTVRGDDAVPGGGQLHHSTDAGATFTRVPGPQPHFRCLERHDGKLWACGNNLTSRGDAFALGVSADGGLTWSKKFAFGELCQSIACAETACRPVLESSCVPGLCAATAVPEGGRGDREASGGAETPDAGPDGPSAAEPSGCCRIGGGADSPAAAPVALLLVALALAVRRPA